MVETDERTIEAVAGSEAMSRIAGALLGAALAASVSSLALARTGATAPGAPGAPGTWSFAGKVGIGTAYAPYGPDFARSRVWFSIADGAITETMWGLIHEAQLREARMGVLVDGKLETATAANTTVDYLTKDAAGRPTSLSYRIVSRPPSGRWEIEQHVFTDPAGDVLFTRIAVRALNGDVEPVLLIDPHMGSTSGGDTAAASAEALRASDGAAHLSVRASVAFARTSVGFVGASDGAKDLADGRFDDAYASTGATPGNVALTASLGRVPSGGMKTVDVVYGFGATAEAADAAARASLARGHDAVLAAYDGRGAAVGWEDYLASLPELERLRGVATDGGWLANVSALVLKAQEDKSHPGALIASLSFPWGDTASAERMATGYKGVWPRDFYQVASAFLALGDTATPTAALDYLRTVQVNVGPVKTDGAGGWFMQKAHVDGTPEWVAVQLDQTAMPIMLAYKMWKSGVIDRERLVALYQTSLKPAADFLVTGGKVNVDWNTQTIVPPRTQQERWEEQGGYSPATTAAYVAGLITAADIAEAAGDARSARRYRAQADRIAGRIEQTMFTTTGAFREAGGNGRYYLRINPDERPGDGDPLESRNGQPELTEEQYLDAGFLELVRYGVRPADFPQILDSLEELDSLDVPDDLRVRYEFRFPGEDAVFSGWRRYGNDGYGENTTTGGGYGTGELPGGMGADQRGRVWPHLTGERGHYELARAATDADGLTDADVQTIRRQFVRGMELFANSGGMLPEQVFDGLGNRGPHQLVAGEGTNSATPLAWTHAEYLKLLRSIADRKVWDRYDNVAARYSAGAARR